jgi:hypothetical protein
MNRLQGVIRGKTIELASDPGLPEGEAVEVQLQVIDTTTAHPAGAANTCRLPGPPPGWLPGCQETAAGMLAQLWNAEDDLLLARIEKERGDAVLREIDE